MFGQLHRFPLLCLFMMFASWTFGQEPPSAGVHVAYSFRDKEVVLGQPVVLTFTLVNRGGRTVHVDLGQDRKGGFAFTIIQPDQQVLAVPAFSREGISQLGIVLVESGQTFSEDLILDEWYRFTMPGEYRVQAMLKEPIVDADGRRAFKDKGFELRLAIGAKNRVQLEYLCATLIGKLSKAQSYSEAAKEATELSYVADPVAVSYLKRGLELDKLVEPLLIAGLERIGDDSAVQVLIGGLQSGSQETRSLARSALQRVYGATESSDLRKQIDQALVNGDTQEK